MGYIIQNFCNTIQYIHMDELNKHDRYAMKYSKILSWNM